MHPTSKGRDTQNKRKADCETLDWRRHETTLSRSAQSQHAAEKLHRAWNTARQVWRSRQSITCNTEVNPPNATTVALDLVFLEQRYILGLNPTCNEIEGLKLKRCKGRISNPEKFLLKRASEQIPLIQGVCRPQVRPYSIWWGSLLAGIKNGV